MNALRASLEPMSKSPMAVVGEESALSPKFAFIRAWQALHRDGWHESLGIAATVLSALYAHADGYPAFNAIRRDDGELVSPPLQLTLRELRSRTPIRCRKRLQRQIRFLCACGLLEIVGKRHEPKGMYFVTRLNPILLGEIAKVSALFNEAKSLHRALKSRAKAEFASVQRSNLLSSDTQSSSSPCSVQTNDRTHHREAEPIMNLIETPQSGLSHKTRNDDMELTGAAIMMKVSERLSELRHGNGVPGTAIAIEPSDSPVRNSLAATIDARVKKEDRASLLVALIENLDALYAESAITRLRAREHQLREVILQYAEGGRDVSWSSYVYHEQVQNERRELRNRLEELLQRMNSSQGGPTVSSLVYSLRKHNLLDTLLRADEKIWNWFVAVATKQFWQWESFERVGHLLRQEAERKPSQRRQEPLESVSAAEDVLTEDKAREAWDKMDERTRHYCSLGWQDFSFVREWLEKKYAATSQVKQEMLDRNCAEKPLSDSDENKSSLEEKTTEELHRELREIDPEMAAFIAEKSMGRDMICRALQVARRK